MTFHLHRSIKRKTGHVDSITVVFDKYFGTPQTIEDTLNFNDGPNTQTQKS